MTSTTAPTQGEARRLGILIVGFVGIAQVASIALNLGTPFQPLLSIIFVLTCPGFLLFDLDKPRDVSARLLLSIGGSLAINIAIATVVLVAEARWIAPMIALVLVAIAALPRDRLRDAVTRIGTMVGVTQPPLALPAGEPEEVTFEEDVRLGGIADDSVETGALIEADAILAVVSPLAAEDDLASDREGDTTAASDELPAADAPPAGDAAAPESEQEAAQTDVADDELSTDEATAGAAPEFDEMGAETAEETIAAGGETLGSDDEEIPGEPEDDRAETADPTPPADHAPAVEDDFLIDPVEAEADIAGSDEAGTDEIDPVETDPIETETAVAEAYEDDAETIVASAVVHANDLDDMAVAAPQETQIGATVGVGEIPGLTVLEVPVLDAETEAPALLDLNTADGDALLALPGVGPRLADRIVHYRTAAGPFETFDDLLRVPGIGPSKLRAFPDVATMSAPPPESAPPDVVDERADSDEPAEDVAAERTDEPGDGAAEPTDSDTNEPSNADGPADSDEPTDTDEPADSDEPAEDVAAEPTDEPGDGAAEPTDSDTDEPADQPPRQMVIADHASPGPSAADPADSEQPEAPAKRPRRTRQFTRSGAPNTEPAETEAAATLPFAYSLAPSPEAVNVNRASALELTALPGVGPSLATRIVEHRGIHGPFAGHRDLEAVNGLGPAKVTELAELVRFSEPLVDLNAASAAQLESVQGIGAELAQRIIAHRDTNGPFASVDDLTTVSGVGAKSLEALRPQVTV